MADNFTNEYLRAIKGTAGTSTAPAATSADDFTNKYLAEMGATNKTAQVQSPATPYKLRTVLNGTVKPVSVPTTKATAPKTDAPKTETAKQTTATETEFDPVTGFNLPTTKAALADANVFGKKVASGLDTLRLSNTANPKDYVLDETTGFMMPSSDFGEAVIQKGSAAAVGTVRNTGNEASYLLQQVGRRAEGMNSGDYVMELDPATGFELPTPKSTDTSPLKTTFNFGRKYQEAADTRFKKYETDPINKAIGDVSTGVGGMVPSIVSNFIVPGSGIWVMATGAAGGATEEALKNGASNESALTYGIAVGAIEAATEKIADGLGGIMGKGWSDEWVSNEIKQVCQKESTAKAINAFADALGEGFEEWVAEYAEAYANKLMVEQDERNFKDISGDALYSFAIGSLISVAMQGADIKSINPKSAGEQAASQCIQSISQNTDNNTATLQNTQNPVQAPVIAQDATQAKPATYTENAAEPNTAQQGAEQEKTQAPQSKGIFPQGSLGAQLALTTQTQANNKPRTYDEAQKTIDDYTDTLIAKYGEDEALFVDPDTKFNYSTMKPSKMSDAEIGKLADMYKARDGIAENEKNTAINSIMNAIPSKDYKNEGWAASKNDIREALEEIYHNNELSNAFHGGAQTVDIANELYNILIRKTDVDAPRELWGNYDLAKSVSEDRLRYPFGQSPAPLLEQIDDIVNAMTNPGVSQASTAPAQKPAPMFLPDSLGAKITGELPSGVGAAERGFAGDYNAWQMDTKAGDFHPDGENAARTVDLPKVNPQGENTMKTAATVMESQNTPDARVAEIEKYMADGKAAYIPVTDADAKAAAEATLELDGWDKTLTDWTAKVRGNQVSKELVAQGAVLLNNAANSAATSQQYLDIFNDYAALLHNSGQSLQAARLLKTLSPEGRLYGITKSIESMVKELKGKVDITLDPALVEEYRNATTDAQRDAAIDKIASDIARQTPSNFLDKWTALRYVNMLGNFKTQVRNIAGNVGMGVVAKIKRGVSAGIESVVRAATGGKYQKTASFLYSPALFKAALNDFQSVKSAAMGEGKYNDNTPTNAFERSVQDKRTIFKNNGVWGTNEGKTALSRSAAMKGVRKATGAVNSVFEAYRKVTNAAMEGGDYIFSIANYADALAGYLQAHGVKADTIKASMDGSVGSLDGSIDAKLLDAARQYAIKEAQEATFRDTNAVSKWASQVGRGKNTPKAVKVVAEGVLPFRKTPANIAVRAEEYSPLGLINTTVKAIEAAKGTGNVTGADVMNSLSKSLTGTGIFMLGYALTKAGLLRSKDKDEEKEAIAKLTGHQDYALELPNGTSITLDWITPASMPLFMGGAFYTAAAENGFQAKDIEATLTYLLDPMIELSMVNGVNDALNNVKYSDSGIIQLVLSSAVGYLTQGLTNTLLGQAERTTEENRQSTYVGKDSSLPSWLARQIGKASAKTPGFDYAQADYIDAWGRKQSNGSVGSKIFNNFFNPSYVSKVNETTVDKELNRLYEQSGDGTVFPKTANKSFKVSGTEYDLSAGEYGTYQQTYGKYAFNQLDMLFKSSDYKSMSDEDKAKAVGDIYSAATVEAKRKIIEGRGEMYLPDSTAVKLVDSFAGAGLSKDKAYSLYKTLDALTPEQGKSSVSNQQKAKTVVQQGYSKTQTVALVGTLWDKTGADECKTLLPSLNVAQRLVTMYVDSGNSDLVNMTTPRTFSENSVTYELTDAEMTQFSKVYADYFNQRATNLMSEDTLVRIKKEAYNRAKYSVINGRK